MPKSKPDQVIIHRIEFQDTEREILSLLGGSLAAQNLSKSVYNLTSDVTSVIVLLLLYEMSTGKDTGLIEAFAGLGGGTYSGISDWVVNRRNSAAYQEQYNERASDLGGGFQNLIDNIVYAIFGASSRRINPEE